MPSCHIVGQKMEATNSLPCFWVEVNAQPHIPPISHPVQVPPVPTHQDNEWAPRPVWILRIREKSLGPAAFIQAAAYSQY